MAVQTSELGLGGVRGTGLGPRGAHRGQGEGQLSGVASTQSPAAFPSPLAAQELSRQGVGVRSDEKACGV